MSVFGCAFTRAHFFNNLLLFCLIYAIILLIIVINTINKLKIYILCSRSAKGENKMKSAKRIISVLIAAVLMLLPFAVLDASAAGKWVSSWTTSMVNGSISVAGLSLNDIIPSSSTVRTELTVTTGGSKLRFEFSNQYGNASITIKQACVAKTNTGVAAAIVAGSAVPITFNEGQNSVTIPAGKTVWSDDIDYKTEALDCISVSTYFSSLTYMKTAGLSNARTYMSIASGNMINNPNLTNASEVKISSSTITYHTSPFLCRVDTLSADANACTAVFIGDSTLVNNTYLYYAQRVVDAGVKNTAIVNQAIVGNRLLSKCTGNLIGNLFGDSLESRFQRDVLDIAGVKYCFIKIGLNDLIHQYSGSLSANTPKYTPEDVIAGYTRLVNLCHQNGIKVYFFTKSAWKGYSRAFLGQTNDLVWSAEAQAKCDVLDNWVRTNTIADGWVDCSPLADPSDTVKLCSTLTIDGAHLSTLGSIALADMIPLSYVGVGTAGRSAATINGADPYAEKRQIIADMANTTAATEAPTQAPTQPATEPTTQGNQQGAVVVPSTTAPSGSSGSTGTTGTTTAATPVEVTTKPADTVSAEEYTVATIPQETYSVPAIVNGGAEGGTDVANYQYKPTYSNYNIQDTIDVSSIGSGGGVVFILVLFMIIIVVGAVILTTVTKKKGAIPA